MVIADWLRTKLRQRPSRTRMKQFAGNALRKRRRQGNGNVPRAALKAVPKSTATWREWNRRRMEAEARGEEFNEPEPYQRRTVTD